MYSSIAYVVYFGLCISGYIRSNVFNVTTYIYGSLKLISDPLLHNVTNSEKYFDTVKPVETCFPGIIATYRCLNHQMMRKFAGMFFRYTLYFLVILTYS